MTQWGVHTSGVRNTKKTFPVSFTSIYQVIATMRTTNSSGASGSQSCQYVSNLANTSFQGGSYDAGNGCAGFTYIAIGKK